MGTLFMSSGNHKTSDPHRQTQSFGQNNPKKKR